MVRYFSLRKKSKLVLTVATTISLCVLFHELFSNDNQITWDYRQSQCVQYVGQRPPCSQYEQLKGPVLCSTLRELAPKDSGDITVDFETISEEELEDLHGGDLETGGLYRPKDCSPDQRVAIIVPYRDRDGHLKVLLNNLHPFLKKQKVQYMIIVVEQAQGTQMNRAMLRNIGFLEAEKMCNFDCYFFHDVDMIPLREDNIYQCKMDGSGIRHHAACLARWNYSLPYTVLTGGVCSFERDIFKKINGYSNLYFGWGGEDDDLALRVKKYHNLTIDRYPMEVSKYEDLSHKQSKLPGTRLHLYYTWDRRVSADGLNSIKYHIHMVEFRKLYTRIYVGINEAEVLEQFQDIFKENVTILREKFEERWLNLSKQQNQ